MKSKPAIAFKYCQKGCGADYYYGYSVEQTIGTIDMQLDSDSYDLILFDNSAELVEKTTNYDHVITIYLFRNIHAYEVYDEVDSLEDSKFTNIASGTHPSGDPKGALKHFDYVVVGDCELAISELIDSIFRDDSEIDIQGVWKKDGTEIIEGGKTIPIDLDQIPPFAANRELFSPIEISRGCPWACRFCCVPYIYGGKIRHRSIENIVKAVKEMKEQGRRVVNFLTPNSFAYGSSDGLKPAPDQIRELLSELAKIKDMKIIYGNYLSNVRPDFVTDELVELVKKYTQTPSIHMGGQSGSDRVLEYNNTGYTVARLIDAVKTVRKHGLGCSVDIIVGLPGETDEDLKKSVDLVEELVELGAVPRVHAFMPLPGTPFADMKPGILSKKTISTLGRISRKGKVMQPFKYEEGSN